MTLHAEDRILGNRQPAREPLDPAAFFLKAGHCLADRCKRVTDAAEPGELFTLIFGTADNMDPKSDFAKYILDPDELLEKKKELLRLGGTRDQIARALKSAILKPQQREQFKKALPLYEAKIRALRDRILANDLLGNLNPDDIRIPTHYQDRKK